EAAARALLAGCDLLLYGMPGGLWRTGYRGARAALRSGRIPVARVEEALERVGALARRYPSRPAARPALPGPALRRRWDAAVAASIEIRGRMPDAGSVVRVWGAAPHAGRLAEALARRGVRAELAQPARAAAKGRRREPDALELLVIPGRKG